MTKQNRLGTLPKLLFTLLSCNAAQAAQAAGIPVERITVLITHPRASELENIAHLVHRGLFQVPNLMLLGIHHASEWESYEDAETFIRERAPDWIKLKKLTCQLDSDSIYRENNCTPVFQELFKQSAAILFTGGPDIPPMFYGQPTLLTTVIEDPPRHLFELSFLFHLLGSNRNSTFPPLLSSRPNYAILGLCLGMQSMSVATGGTLVQDIPTQIYGIKTFEEGIKLPAENTHYSFSTPLNPVPGVGWEVMHPVLFVGNSETKNLLLANDGPVQVVSLHHQAAGELGQGFEVLATSLDGKVVEAIRHKRFPGVFGVQFHPEKKLLWNAWVEPGQEKDLPIMHHATTSFRSDQRSQDFHEAFWHLFGNRIRKSANSSRGQEEKGRTWLP